MFDLFWTLAQDDPHSPDHNMPRQEYRRDEADSHPNQLANEAIGSQLADFIVDVTRHYRSVYESTDSK